MVMFYLRNICHRYYLVSVGIHLSQPFKKNVCYIIDYLVSSSINILNVLRYHESTVTTIIRRGCPVTTTGDTLVSLPHEEEKIKTGKPVFFLFVFSSIVDEENTDRLWTTVTSDCCPCGCFIDCFESTVL